LWSKDKKFKKWKWCSNFHKKAHTDPKILVVGAATGAAVPKPPNPVLPPNVLPVSAVVVVLPNVLVLGFAAAGWPNINVAGFCAPNKLAEK
jgi:hypothetical protein